MDGKRFVGYIKIPWLGYLMLAVAALGAAVLVYLVLLSFVNRIVLRVERGRLRVFHSPLPWPPGSVDLALKDIRQFEPRPARAKQGGKAPAKPTVSMLVVDGAGRKHQLIAGLESEAQFAWLEGELRRILGMPPPAARNWSWQTLSPEEPSPAPAPLVAAEQEPGTAAPTEQSAPRGLFERLVRGLLAHGLGYLATTQQVYAVGGHFGWLMMVIIGLQEGGTGSLMKEASQGLLQLYTVLGGVDETGRGGIPEMMDVWGKVSLIIYLVELLISKVRGSKQPWSLKRKWAASTLLACIGYALAFALMASTHPGSADEMLGVIPFLVLFTSMTTWWALSFGKFMRFMQQQIRGERPQQKPQEST